MKKFITIILLICISLSLPCFASNMNAEAYFKTGVSKQKLKDYKGALEDYNKAIQLNPNDFNAYSNRGADKFELKDYKGAIEDYTMAIQLNLNKADNSEFYFNRGAAKASLKDYEDSITDFTKATQLNSDNSRAYLNRGLSKAELKDYKGSIKDFSKAIKSNPNYFAAYCNRGLSEAELKDYNKAIKDYNKALFLQPNYIDVYKARAEAKKAIGDLNGAEKDSIIYNWQPYRDYLQKAMKTKWNPPKELKSNSVVLLFKIRKDGKLLSAKVLESSGSKDIDEAALKALHDIQPLKPLPSKFKGKSKDIEFTFNYNVHDKK